MKVKAGGLKDSLEIAVINCLVMDNLPHNMDREELTHRVVEILSDPECSAAVLQHAYRKIEDLEIRVKLLQRTMYLAFLERRE